MKNYKRKLYLFWLVLLLMSMGGCFVPTNTTMDNAEQTAAIKVTPENTEAKLRNIEQEMTTVETELTAAEEELATAQIEGYEESAEPVELTDQEEEIYLAELENDLEQYNLLIREVEELADEMETLLVEYEEILNQTEEFYDELSTQTQQAVDNAQEIYDTTKQNIETKKGLLADKKTELESMQEMVNLREKMQIDPTGTISTETADKQKFLADLTVSIDNLKNVSQSVFCEQFVNKYMSRVPSFMMDGQFRNLGSGFGAGVTGDFRPGIR